MNIECCECERDMHGPHEKWCSMYVERAGICELTTDRRTDLQGQTYVIIADLIHSNDRLVEIAARHGLTRQRIHQVHQQCIAAGIYKRRRIYQ